MDAASGSPSGVTPAPISSRRTGGKNMKRLPQTVAQRIDPSQKLLFSYRGKSYQGSPAIRGDGPFGQRRAYFFQGASKYHRPRGLFSLDGQCSNCLMEIDGIPTCGRRNRTSRRHDGCPSKRSGVPRMGLAGRHGQDGLGHAGGLFIIAGFHKPYRFCLFSKTAIREMAGIGKDESGLAGRPLRWPLSGMLKCA